MAKSENQKIKILYLKDLFMETDPEHPLTMEEILMRLKGRNIDAERKSIYSDIEALRTYGLDIALKKQGRTAAYYLRARDFEASELKMMIDSVQIAPFLSEKRSQKLVQKIAAMSSRSESDLLGRKISCFNRNKARNDSLVRSMDTIQSAMLQDLQIRFRYWRYGPDQKPDYLHGGKALHASPFALLFQHSSFYMAAYMADTGSCATYRVDRMSNIALLQNTRIGKEVFSYFDISKFMADDSSRKKVLLRAAPTQMETIMDRFGPSVSIVHTTNDSVIIEVATGINPDFYGWIASQNNQISIESEDIRAAYYAYLHSLIQA